jgi:eukaryotic-like serine/threonine-protein kinase
MNSNPMVTPNSHDSVLLEIGKYRLIAELAQGGMGNVYLAVAQGPAGFNKLVVVKELKPELCDDQSYVAMFLDEARLAARLIHPNIVQTNEVGSDGRRHFMVMEYLDGRSLHRIGRRLGDRLTLGSRLRIVGDCLLGLHFAHELREFDGVPLDVVHRDVGPLNVFVTFAGQAKVIDFGIAKATDSSFETKVGVIKGRVAYMSPEQACGTKVDRRSDVYSAGVMLWEAAAGRRLWPGLNDIEILKRLLGQGPPLLRDVAPDAPRDLQAICDRAMATSRDARYATAADLLGDLEGHLAVRNDVLGMREIGALAAQVFADERRKMAAVIDQTLTRLRGGHRSGITQRVTAPIAGGPASGRLAVAAQMCVPTPASGSLPLSGATLPPRNSSRAAPATTTTLQPPWESRWGSKRVALLGSAASALLLGCVLLGLAVRYVGTRHAGLAAPVPATDSALVAAAAAPHEAPELVEVIAHVSPPTAQIAIDGAPVLGNPFHGHYPKNGEIHHIFASADGYESKSKDISFDDNLSLDVSLDRRVVVSPARPTAPPSGRVVRHSAPPAPPVLLPHDVPLDRPADRSATVWIDLPRPATSGEAVRPALRPITSRNPYAVP